MNSGTMIRCCLVKICRNFLRHLVKCSEMVAKTF